MLARKIMNQYDRIKQLMILATGKGYIDLADATSMF